MAKRVFFSFHYDDVKSFRANVVRQHWLTKPNREIAGFFDASIWEKVKKEGFIALKRMINNALKNTTNTCVLIGTETHIRPWVRYEIFKSFIKGNHIIGVHVNGIKDKLKQTKNLGKNPFDYLGYKFNDLGTHITLYEKTDNKWIEYSSVENKSTFKLKRSIVAKGGKFVKFSEKYKIYKWNKDKGYDKFGDWIN
ncbi:TIR domain-containing protein [Christiangramia sp. LLG6405-1]|uniref:TIR domain-containing protein n=1 Tax=Christiangramia sp. LLG6405-1 TaxID=3160832 RepID=UPI00386843D5